MEQQNYNELIKNILPTKFKDSKNYLAYVRTFGCQQNFADSEKIKGLLKNAGFNFTDDVYKANIIVFNTCTIRNHAENRVIGNLGIVKKIKENSPNLVVVICGCMTQQEKAAEKLKKMFPFINLILGTNYFKEFYKLLYEALSSKKTIPHDNINNINCESIEENVPIERDSKIKASVSIMYGCNNFCSYCIVPYVRGREKSRKSLKIINEVKNLVTNGYKEILLLGQNVNSYGKGSNEGINFAKLLKILDDIKGDYWIRFMTSHPKDITKKLIDTISESTHIPKNIHLPVQSGSNRILKDMNRHYTKEKYVETIDYIKSKIPAVSLSSDVIVGFPNETEEEFLETVSLIKKVKYSLLYTFIYSKRDGTPAAKIKDLVPYKEKVKRLKYLINVQNEISSEIFKKLVGTTQKILVDSKKEPSKNVFMGRTEGNIPVKIYSEKDVLGKFINAKILNSRRAYLEAKF